MTIPENLSGLKFHHLTVVRFHDKTTHRRWFCHCVCGNTAIVKGIKLKSGHTKSCGCFKIEKFKGQKYGLKHGGYGTRLYNIWRHMKRRCFQKNWKDYKYYGQRGITVCNRWLKFENFRKDMGEPTTNKHSIDRINVNGNYEPGNCRWATSIQQANNKRCHLNVVVQSL